MKRIAYPYYLIGVLGLLEGYNGLSRTAWALLLEDIKRDLVLSDTQLGLLSGIAYALFYGVMGIPIARWADRGFRVRVIALTTAVSAAMVALCGATQTTVQLMWVRIGVAIGDAGCRPPAHSLIAAYFSRSERARATSLFLLGSYLFFVIGTSAVGWANELYGWRSTFILIGLPGFALAALAGLTLREPQGKCGSTDIAADGLATTASEPNPRFKEVLATLWSNRTFRYLLCAWTASTFLESGVMQWEAAFFVRTHHLGTGELGTWLSVMAVLSIVGMYTGGELASRYAANDERRQLSAIAMIFASYGLLSVGVYMAPSIYLAFAIKAICALGAAMMVGPMLAIVQTLTSPRMRAVSIAVVLLFANLVGMGIGPLAVGALSDALIPSMGDQSLRYALVAASPGYLLAGYCVWQARKSVTHDLDRVLGKKGQEPGESAFFPDASKENLVSEQT